MSPADCRNPVVPDNHEFPGSEPPQDFLESCILRFKDRFQPFGIKLLAVTLKGDVPEMR